MDGPDPRGPTLARRLIGLAVALIFIAITIGPSVRRVVDAGLGAVVGDVLGASLRVESSVESPAESSGQQAAAAGDGATIEQAIAASAFVILDLSNGRTLREQKGEWLDAPVWPGSIAKLATFAAAIDAHALTDSTRVMCTRRLTLADGRRVDCSHPPLGHALSPVEALAYSCNVFTATIARALTREQLSSGFVRMGLSPVPAGVDLVASALGLDGAKVAPRKLIEPVRRAANLDITILRDGLRESARIGTSSAFAAAGIEALAKTGTAPMRGGRALGLVSAVTPASSPRYGIVVALPGGSGAQAAETAAAILRSFTRAGASGKPGTRGVSGAGGASGGTSGSARDAVDRLDASAFAASSSRAASVSQAGASAAVRVGQPTAKGYAVETLDVEEYVARVVAGETSDATPAAAREAVAIAARTFASVNRGRHAGDGFDLCTLTHCQVTRPATRSSRAAATATRGQVLVDDRDGRPAPVFYSASCGGTIADARTLLPNADPVSMPWLTSRPDPAGIAETTWQTDIPADDLLHALQQNGSRGDTLRNLIVHTRAGAGIGRGSGVDDGARADEEAAARNRSGAESGSGASSRGSGPAAAANVTHVTTEGLTPSTLGIDDFRRAIGQQLGWQLLKSTRFTVQRTSRGYRFTGRGHGHGVGLCVLGASALAARGDDAARILQAYFPGLQTTIPGARSTSAATQPSARTRAGRADAGSVNAGAGAVTAGATINLRLPSDDERERPRLVRLIATNLRELALDLSLPSPAALDVVVHPTVAAYRRATHSPSWTSAATILRGDDITLHFAPIDTLDRGAMLTQTVRHELVHVLTIRALLERPRWVHEGLALHLAGERVSAGPEETSSDAVKCPSDRDLMRPRSRSAFDQAYSRAAACVARDLAAGRNWRELGTR